jgi:enoyl-CoA hydratase/carnithine racemase
VADEVLYRRAGPVAWLTINRPGARNALDQAVRRGLFEGFARFQADDAAVLVLTGAGTEAFSAGGDLKEMAEVQLRVPPPDFLPQLGRNVHLDKPVIAAVNGIAYGGGFLLAQNCDLCLAADTARFGITEARWGRGAPWAAWLPRLVPPRVALQLLLTAEPIDARRAHEVGLVNEVMPVKELAARAQALGERIAANAPLSVKAGKAMVHQAAELRREEAFAAAEAIFAPAYLSDDAQEGPRAFREKRPPRWTGR